MEESKLTLTNALDIFSDNLNDIKIACISNLSDILDANPKPEPTGNKTEDWVRLEVRNQRVELLTDNHRRVIKRIVGKQTPVKRGSITDDMIERAKEYPIKELFAELVNTPVKAGMAQCPFHPDDTASFSLRRYNRYRCFGCDERGSVIDLYMKLNGVNFIQAVKNLQ